MTGADHEIQQAENVPTPTDQDLQRGAKPPRFRPGFPWGLATGALSVVLLVVLGAAILWVVTMSKFNRVASRSQAAIVVSPVNAGQDWFTVGSDKRGRLQGWSDGSSGSGGSDGPSGAIGEFDVGALGSVDGVTVKHMVTVYVTPKTEFVIGSQQYQKGKSSSAAAAIFGGDDGPETDVLGDRRLTITFHRVGDAIVADRVTAPLESGQNPLNS